MTDPLSEFLLRLNVPPVRRVDPRHCARCGVKVRPTRQQLRERVDVYCADCRADRDYHDHLPV